jgi:hypothetical protein
MSHRRAQSAMSTSSRHGRVLVQPVFSGPPLKPSEVVPSATYMERGQRWMEKEEACALRDALEDMDFAKEQEEEARLHAAAQAEASELVWQHQNPQAIIPDDPYKYKEHLRKNSYAHARTASVGRYSGQVMATGLARDYTSRSVSGASNVGSQRDRVSSESSNGSSNGRRSMSLQRQNRNSIDESGDKLGPRKIQKPYPGLSNTFSGGSTRRSSSRKRNISGELGEVFNPDQIWEEPESPQDNREGSPELGDMPAPLRLKPRNPLNRVQFEEPPRSNSTPPERSKRFNRYEIHQNPPTQTRNPAYTANNTPKPSDIKKAEVPLKDGLEIRGEDIRQATSMKLKDRSPKLPTPVFVSDRPGRPIVSFDANWKPREAEADLKPVEEQRRPRVEQRIGGPRESKGFAPQAAPPSVAPAPIPTIQLPDVPAIQINEPAYVPAVRRERGDIPTINFPDTPSISVSASPNVPTISISDVPSISVSAPPSISVSAPPAIFVSDSSKTPTTTSSRPLPDPKTASRRPFPRPQTTIPSSRGHWSPAGPRATATCHQCRQPIEGRVVALAGLAERFHPQCFSCHICGTSLEALEISPEPEPNRLARLDRIARRARGEVLEELEGQSMGEDGDERLRFYCHLDWHELFAPRCKHCKTPIIGEHAVALGEHWHYGHFFCAECGDPFEAGMTHIEKDGYAWCLTCQTKRTERRAPKCGACKKAVIGEYVQALGKEWHEGCFRCGECKGGFEDGQIFVRGSGILCTVCMERALKA